MSRQPTHARANDVSFLSYVLRHLSIEAVIWIEFPRMASSISRQYIRKSWRSIPNSRGWGNAPARPESMSMATVLIAPTYCCQCEIDDGFLRDKSYPNPQNILYTDGVQCSIKQPYNSEIEADRTNQQPTHSTTGKRVASFHAIFYLPKRPITKIEKKIVGLTFT